MNVDIIDLLFKIPRGILSPCEKMLLLAVASSIPTFGYDGSVLALGENISGVKAKRRKGKGCIIDGDVMIENYPSMFYNEHERRYMRDGIYRVSETNPVMRLDDYLKSEENLTIKVLANKTGYSESAIRSAKQSLITKGYLLVEVRDNKQYWIIQAVVLQDAQADERQTIKHYPKRARPHTVEANKKRKEEAARVRADAEEEKKRAEAEEGERRKEEVSVARLFHIPVNELRKMLDKGEAWRDEDGEIHIDDITG